MSFDSKGSIFSGIGETESASGPKIYFEEEGVYRAKLVEVAAGKSENPKRLNQPYAAHKFEILESQAVGEDVPQPVGTVVSYSKYITNEWALRDVKALVAAVIGCPQAEITTQIADEFYEESESVIGKEVLIRVKARKNNGKLYHNLHFKAVE